MTAIDDDKDTRFTWGEDIVRESQTVEHKTVRTEDGEFTMLYETGNDAAVLVMYSDHTVDTEWP